jgi:hypothetical protein
MRTSAGSDQMNVVAVLHGSYCFMHVIERDWIDHPPCTSRKHQTTVNISENKHVSQDFTYHLPI